LSARRTTQLHLPFPQPAFDHELYRAQKKAAGRAIILERQPTRWPRGYFRQSLQNPYWRDDYFLLWQQRRKALGLPYAIPGWLHPLGKRVS
jgi:hypothetical protein